MLLTLLSAGRQPFVIGLGMLCCFALASCRQAPAPAPAPADAPPPTNSKAAPDTLAALATPHNLQAMQGQGLSPTQAPHIWYMPLALPSAQAGSRPGSSSYADGYQTHWWNIIFYNHQTGQTYPLTRQKMLIAQINIQPPAAGSLAAEEEAPRGAYLYYLAHTTDANADGQLTTADPAYLFITNRQGLQWRQISPPGYHVLSWQVLAPGGQVVMKLAQDTNQNQRYTDAEDATTLFITDPASEAPARPLVPPGLQHSLLQQYQEQWGPKPTQ